MQAEFNVVPAKRQAVEAEKIYAEQSVNYRQN